MPASLPIRFAPLPMERVWGGRALEQVYGRLLPDQTRPYGESWEIVDREDEQSVVSTGGYTGASLHDLWARHRAEIFGDGFENIERFPLLVKILDACEDLSIQVHPPASIAPSLGGEPKTEMWYIADATPGAKLYVGLKNGVTRADFELAIANGTVADCVHAIEPKSGESIFIPSGRLHAIGGGLLIFEIQQNSDTTYRVFDWNRKGLDGKPRALHVKESLASIDFHDFEPGMDIPQGHTLARCEHFQVDRLTLHDGESIANPDPNRFSLVGVISGALVDTKGGVLAAGDFALLPKGAAALTVQGSAVVLQTTVPRPA